LLIDDVAGVNI